MAYDQDVAAVLRQRLALMKAIDEAAELSFMESAGFRLELFSLLRRLDDGAITAEQALIALGTLHHRVSTVIGATAN